LGVAVVNEDSFTVGILRDANTALDSCVIDWTKSVQTTCSNGRNRTGRASVLNLSSRGGKSEGREGDEDGRYHGREERE
jgi:hypothetical protein